MLKIVKKRILSTNLQEPLQRKRNLCKEIDI